TITGVLHGDSVGTITCSTGYTQYEGAGTYSGATSCSGAVNANYSFTYVAGALMIAKAGTSILYTGEQFLTVGNTFTPASTLSSPVSACEYPQLVTYSLDINPTTGIAGTYIFGVATTTAGGFSSLSLNTANWLQNIYTVAATFAGSGNCNGSSSEATVTIIVPGDKSTGGGWYLPGSGVGRTNFGFEVHLVPNTTNTYKGEIVVVSGAWRFKGTLNSYGQAGTQWAANGSGNLYSWNQSLNNGLGDWQLVASGVSVVATFTPTSSGKKSGPGTFGVEINYSPVPASFLNSLPTSLKGGNINAS
ncbi:MAG TPA: MBG domain-containing protein, partial [Acidimicrobiales bacterium]|nr:MBG domain-containing protein [Acidimicrobiales bacterium]